MMYGLDLYSPRHEQDMTGTNTKGLHLVGTPVTSVRTFHIDGCNWIVAVDLCRVLGYTAATRITRGFQSRTFPVETAGGIQNLLIIREVDAYAFIVMSRKLPDALKESVLSKISDLSGILRALSDFEIPEDLPEMYVYAIREKDTGHLKLGISRDPESRLKALQTGNSSELELISQKRALNRFRDEQALHLVNTNLRIRGEWFQEGASVLPTC